MTAVLLVLILSNLPARATADPTYRFTKLATYETGGWANGGGITADNDGNVYEFGQFGGTVHFGGAGSEAITAVGNVNAFLTKFTNHGTAYAWAKIIVGADTDGWSLGTAVKTDATGAVYVLGEFGGTVLFDGVGGTHDATNSLDSSGSFVAKYSTSGTYIWSQVATSDVSMEFASPTGLAVDSNHNVFAVGTFMGTVAFDPGDIQTTTGTNGYLTKYNANGSYGWTKTFDVSATDTYANIAGVAIDSHDNVFVAANGVGTVVFDGSHSHTSDIDNSMIVKYSNSGSVLQVIADITGYTNPFSIAIDANNNIFMGGVWVGDVSFGGGETMNPGSESAFVTKYSADGTYLWTRVNDSNSSSYVMGLTTDAAGNVYSIGRLSGTVAFDGLGGSDTRSTINTTTYLSRYNADGTYGWTKHIEAGTTGVAIGSAVAMDTDGNLYFTGYTHGTSIFDGTDGSDTQSTATLSDTVFMTSYKVYTAPVVAASPAASASATPQASTTAAAKTSSAGSTLAKTVASDDIVYNHFTNGILALQLKMQKTIYFCITTIACSSNSNDIHTMLLSTINYTDSSAEVVFHSSPVTVTLSKNQVKAVDITGDGTNDISATLDSLDSDSVMVTLRQLQNTAPSTAKTGGTVANSIAQTSTKNSSKKIWLLLPLLILGVILLLSGKTKASHKKTSLRK